MSKRFIGAIILVVFAFGLIPGEYWKVLHHHKHHAVAHSHSVGFYEKHKSCTNESHLYDYIPVQEIIKHSRIDLIQSFSFGIENHLPHPAFLNVLLRAPPSFHS